MGNFGNVMGVIGAVVALTISLYFVDPIQTANDGFYRLNTDHCLLNSGTTTRNLIVVTPFANTGSGGNATAVGAGNPAVGDVLEVRNSGGSCAVTQNLTTTRTGNGGGAPTATATTEDGSLVTLTGPQRASAGAETARPTVNDANWRAAPSFLGAFQTIVLLVISLVPLMIAVGFIGTAFSVVKQGTENMSGGAGFISKSILVDIGLLLVIVAAVFVAEPFMRGVESAAGVTTAGNLDSADRFSTITRLAYSILPLGYAVGIIGISTRKSWRPAMAGIRYARGKMRGYDGM